MDPFMDELPSYTPITITDEDVRYFYYKWRIAVNNIDIPTIECHKYYRQYEAIKDAILIYRINITDNSEYQNWISKNLETYYKGITNGA